MKCQYLQNCAAYNLQIMSPMSCHCSILQILAKRIIVDTHGEIIEHELSSPFV